MDQVLVLADQMSELIQTSKVYTDYIAAYNRIKNDSEIMNRIHSIKRKHVEFADSYQKGHYDFNTEKYLSQEFYKLMLNKDVETYFMNEHKLVKLLNDIYSKISLNCILQVFE